MKKIDYISKKMIKRMEEMEANNEIEFRKKEILEVANSSFDEIKKHSLLCIESKGLAECQYIKGDYNSSINSWTLCIDHLINAFVFGKKVNTDVAIKIDLEKSKKECAEIYIAYVLNKFEELSQYLLYSKIDDYFDNFEDEYLKGMYDAINEEKQETFDALLEKRIRDIRKMSVDYIVIVDFWSLSLLKYATEKGMKNSLKVIELGYTEQGNNVFI